MLPTPEPAPGPAPARARRRMRLVWRRKLRRVRSMRLLPGLLRWLPPPVGINAAECLRMALGIGLGLLFTALLSRWWGTQVHTHAWMVASLGASAVLVFGMPASPLAQPWPLLAGSVVCLLCAALCQALLRDDALVLALSVALSVALMVLLRCLHPPGVGLAAFVVLEHAPALDLLLFPLLFNACVLLACGVAYNRLTGRRYPHCGQRQGRAEGAPGAQFTDADLDAALGHYNQVLDISRADLEGLLHRAGRAAFERTLGDLRCATVMSHPVVSVPPDMALQDAWDLMHTRQIKALPVVDAQERVLGLVVHADFVRLGAGLPKKPAPALGLRLKNLLLRKAADESVQRVQDIMSSPVQTVRAAQRVMALVPLFSREGHHHLPVLDAREKLVGIITQTDLIRVLAATVAPQTPPPG